MALRVENLSFAYRAVPVLKDIAFTVPQGSLAVLIGANGAGKSTLIRCICGLIRPQSGRVWCGDTETTALSPAARSRLFGYVPQSGQIEPGLTVLETLLYRRGRPEDSLLEQATALLHTLGLGELALRPIHQISGGERQRVFIARALLQEPRCLVLDEPISNLDLKYQYETMELLQTVCRERQVAVIAAIHDINMAGAYADHILLLHDTALIDTGPPEQVITAENIQTAFDVAVKVADIGGRRWILPQRIAALNKEEQP